MTTSSYAFVPLHGPETLNDITGGAQVDPAVAATGNGGAVVFFDAGISIAARLVDASGEPVGDQVVVSDGAGATSPEAVTLSNGNVLVTWQNGSGATQIQGRIYSPTLTPVSEVMTFGRSNGYVVEHPEIAATPDGGFVSAFTFRLNDFDSDVYVRTYDAVGNLLHQRAIHSSSIEREPSVTVLANGNIAVAWEQVSLGDTEIWSAVYSPSLAPVRAPFIVDNDGTINQSVDVAALPDGGYTISYAGNVPGGVPDIRTYRYSETGIFVDAHSMSETAGYNARPSAATSIDGYTAVVNEDITGWDVYGSILTPSGHVVALDGLLQASGGYMEHRPAVTWVDSSTVQLAYSTTDPLAGGDGSGYGIAVSRFGVAHTQTGNDTNETIDGDGLIDVVHGGAGNDTIRTRAGADTLDGGEGNDHLFGGAGADAHIGGVGLDYARYDDANYGNLVINLSNASLNTGAAAGDTFSGIECLVAGAGHDTVVGDAYSNRLFGMGGNDIVRAGVGTDYLDGGDGNDHLYGGAGADTIVGGEGLDYARYDEGNYGNLTIRLDAPGANTGAAAGDTYSGIECIVAGSGNDTVFGDAAANRLFGMGGGDVIDGRAGSDFLEGGAGSDGFRFSTALGATNVDAIADFQHGIDRIMLHSSIFAGIGPTLTANEFGATSGAGRLIIYQQNTGRLFYDEGGAGVGTGPVQFATLAAGTVLDVDDFVMV